MTITAKELAEKLGVSAATISMVINNKPGISEPTKQKILEAAEKYGYDISKRGGALQSLQGTICLVVYKRTDVSMADTPFFSVLAEGIGSGCKEGAYDLVIRYVYDNETIATQIQEINAAQYSGIILLATDITAESLAHFKAITVPVLVLDAYFDTMEYPCVVINNQQGAFLATEHLCLTRKTCPGHLSSSFRIANFEERNDGYLKALHKYQLPPADIISHELTPTEDGAFREMLEIIRSGEKLADCYFADNDLIAVGAIKAFQESGYQVPEDVAIVGFDDLPLCEYLNPPLTTVQVLKQYMGTVCADKILQMIAKQDYQPTKLEIGTNLIIRKSV